MLNRYLYCASIDNIEKHLLGLTQSNILSLALISALTLWVRDQAEWGLR